MMPEEGSSWDMVSDTDLWEGGSTEVDQEDYVLVRQEDIVEGIACFMATYLISLKQTKVCEIIALIGIEYSRILKFLMSTDNNLLTISRIYLISCHICSCVFLDCLYID